MRQNLETFLATVREERGKDLPRYTVEELRRYARCGILAHGFLRLACSACGHEALVGYSCKCRGACPSCSARRMCDVAAHLVDSVLPDTRTRQWVLTAPYVVRRLMALRPDALTACHRIFVTEIARWQKRSSGLAGAETGCVSFVHYAEHMIMRSDSGSTAAAATRRGPSLRIIMGLFEMGGARQGACPGP